jgi:hypothetical protein
MALRLFYLEASHGVQTKLDKALNSPSLKEQEAHFRKMRMPVVKTLSSSGNSLSISYYVNKFFTFDILAFTHISLIVSFARRNNHVFAF